MEWSRRGAAEEVGFEIRSLRDIELSSSSSSSSEAGEMEWEEVERGMTRGGTLRGAKLRPRLLPEVLSVILLLGVIECQSEKRISAHKAASAESKHEGVGKCT